MEPSTIVSLTMGVIAALNELLGYTPDGSPKSISQLISWSIIKCYKHCQNKKEEEKIEEKELELKEIRVVL